MTVRLKDHELLQASPRPVSAMAKSYPAGYLGYAHSHARAQLLYAASGSMRLTFTRGCWVIPPQRAVWLPPGYVHQTSAIGELEMRTLYIREDSCPSAAPCEPRMLGVSLLLRELVLRIVAMPMEYDERGQEGRIVAAALGEIDWTPLDPVRLPPLGDARLRRMEQMLTRSPEDASTLDTWAARLRISTRTLARLIRQETGLSFQVWRDHIRTFAAIPMLAEGRPLIEIAIAVGYETAWSFTAMFKRVTGTLPSRYCT
ncbi:AraC family transcriptional regulator [Silvibacterium dinghuense]|nr:helix-turn-helix transcriptional regulator [Silvibacterium dinghuense]